jgi:hypothetical protein
MYACIPEIGGGFFEGVCRRENRPLAFRDPPLPLDSRIAPGGVVLSEAVSYTRSARIIRRFSNVG